MRAAILALPALSFLAAALASPLTLVLQRPQLDVSEGSDSKVNVSLFVMSRCPDAVSLLSIWFKGVGADSIAPMRERVRQCEC